MTDLSPVDAMATDYRAMCAELVDVFDNHSPPQYKADVLDRARALLAEPEAEGPSLKAKALHELNDVYNRDKIEDSTYDTICRALEALDD